MTKKTERPLYPLPEAVDGGEWEIEGSLRHRVDLNSRGTGGRMSAPLGDSERDRVLKQRALARTKWSPRVVRGRRKDLPDWLIERCEEGRITGLLQHHGSLATQNRISDTPTLEPFEAQSLAAEALRSSSILSMAATYTMLDQTEDYDVFQQALFDMGNAGGMDSAELIGRINTARKLADRATGIVRRNSSNFKRSTLKAAELLMDQAAKEDARADARRRSREIQEEVERERRPKSPEEEAEERKLAEELERSREEAESKVKGSEAAGAFGKVSPDGVGRSGALTEIIRTPLTIPLKARVRSKGHRASDAGAVLRYPHRVLTDQQVFRRKVPKPGGTLLIDQSGSMSLDIEDIEELMSLLPAATIAGYSGWNTHGDLRIFAEKGRRCPSRHLARYPAKAKEAGAFYPGANVVDVPALEWLSQQKGPRIWICDGHVTGIGDAMHPNITHACYDLVRRHRIIQVEHVADAKKIARKLVKP